jgi:hypothetical protein
MTDIPKFPEPHPGRDNDDETVHRAQQIDVKNPKVKLKTKKKAPRSDKTTEVDLRPSISTSKPDNDKQITPSRSGIRTEDVLMRTLQSVLKKQKQKTKKSVKLSKDLSNSGTWPDTTKPLHERLEECKNMLRLLNGMNSESEHRAKNIIHTVKEV